MDDLQHDVAIDGLIDRINNAKETIKDAELPPGRVVRTPRAQLQSFIETSSRMLEMHRGRMLEIESHYQLERIRLLDDYRVQIEHIKHKCAEAVYQLDQKHKHEMADSNELLGRLNAIRSFD